jgi:lipoprotein-anchoring transpeptidase ErfK/SrfK
VRLITAAIGGALVAAAIAAWSLRQDTPAVRPSEPGPAVLTTVAALPEPARKGRLLLTSAQIKEAVGSGTLDRPVKSLLAVDKPLHFGEFAWNDTAIPGGLLWVRIDLASQLISVFRGGHEIGTAVVVYGGDNKQTPSGKFHILARDRDHWSSLYDAAMPYTLKLTNDGVAIHGSTVRWGAATHGCIGVPLEFARRLFEQVRVGDEVVIVPPQRTT